MPEMPIEQDFGRFIKELKDKPLAEMDDLEGLEESEIEEMPDGSAVVSMEFKGPTDDSDFYENLADSLDLYDIDKVAFRYFDLIETDREARKERDKQYEEGLKRTGLGNDAPGGANFNGASKVVHPVMAEGCVDFAARAIKELFPPDGPVRTNIIGEATEEKTAVAERKRDYMNWQLTNQIEEFRDEQEQLLAQLPLGGSQFMKIWYDEDKRRPCVEFVSIDNILLPFSAANFYTAQRVTEQQDITDYEMKRRISSGLYRDVSFIRATMEPEPTASEKANQKIEGKQFQDNGDGLRRVYHVYTWLELEDDTYTKGKSAPYILMLDELDNEVLGLYRNWEDGDDTMTKLDWLVEFKFIPWRGAYAIGLPQLIGSLAAGITGSLRALLDSAHINNAATLLKLKGARISGQSDQVEVTQIVEIEGAPGVDDVRKIAMPMPFNPPSPVLFSLLGFLTEAAKGVVTTSEEKIADLTSNSPVGTTQAMIEQGAAVFSAIHARLHNSQKKVLMVLQRINRWYLDEQKRGDVVQELEIKREDFDRNTDVIPVSDPHIFSETQRMAQTQAVMSYMKDYPALFDPRAVIGRALKQMKVPNINELMPNAAKPLEQAASNENAAMALGKPAFAYPRQDHLAHIQAHLDFATDPILGSNPMIATAFIPQALEHIKQHMMLWYTNQVTEYATGDTGIKINKYADMKDVKLVDKTIAVASQHVKMDTQEVFGQIIPILQQLGQMMSEMQMKAAEAQKAMMGDPEAQAVLQASMAETQRRAARDANDLTLAREKQQIDVALNTENNLTKERMQAVDVTVDELKLRDEQQETAMKLQEAAQRNIGG
jgi:hypothetical protein